MELDRRGENVTIIDSDQRAFLKLPAKFGGASVRGSGTDEAVLREAGAGMTDLLMALTEGDNRNALAAQIGKHLFGIPRVIAKINDPVRAEAYRSLGLETICRTVILSDALVLAAVEGAEATDAKVLPPTAEPIQGAPTPASRAHAIARAAAREEEGVELANGEPEAARVGTVRDPGQEA
jgi:trk/ktr system potassium uptake protein